MFCPKCGASNPDGSTFCGSCGAKIEQPRQVAPTEPVAMRPEAQSPTNAYDSLGTDYRTPETVGGEGGNAPKKKGRPLAVILIVLLVVLGATAGFAFADPFHMMPWSKKSSSASSAGSEALIQVESSSADSAAATSATSATTGAASSAASSATSFVDSGDHTTISLTEEDPNRISPKESIVVSDLKLAEDPVKRYIITGKITNKSTETYDVTVSFAETRHRSDKYGEEYTEPYRADVTSITPFTTYRNNTVMFRDLEPGTREFTIYPWFDSTEEFLSDPTAEVSEVTLPDAQAQSRLDHKGAIKITSVKLAADGKVTIDFVNQTGMYLNSTEVVFVAYMDRTGQKIPAVKSNNGARPTGVVVKSATAEILKPGDTGSFTADIGEGYSSVDVMHVWITPDPEKNTFN